MTYDAIVIGVGGMGSATLYHLARRGAKALGLEQFDIPHDQGSSHGESRIIRLAYAEHPGYVPLLRRAYELWRELEALTQEQLLVITGGIDAGAPESATVKGSLLACETHQLRHEVLTAAEVLTRFPGYRFPSEFVGVFQPDGGFVLPERCIVSHVAAAQSHGADVHTRERVTGWDRHEGGVKVSTDRGSYTARKLILTAGPWAAKLVPSLAKLAVPERQVMLWTQPLRPEFFQPQTFPIFNLEAPERFYGFPVYGKIPGFKIGKYHHRLEKTDPDSVDREIHPKDEAVLREGIRRFFPDADGPTLAMKTCLFTNSPDEHFLLGFHPDAPEVALAAGFSGHGFKFASVIGEIMADLALDGATRHEIGLFRLGRF
jgi:sarcosine oxidase